MDDIYGIIVLQSFALEAGRGVRRLEESHKFGESRKKEKKTMFLGERYGS